MSILALDTETVAMLSGSRYPAMCQIGMIRAGGDPKFGTCLSRELALLINPEVPDSAWQEDAIATTGIRPEDVRDAPTFLEAYPDIFETAFGCRTLVGFNTEFDVGVLAHALRRYGLEHHFPWPLIHIDVMKLAADRFPTIAGKRGNKNPTLSEAYLEATGKELDGAHDALIDIRATLEVYHRCLSI